MQMRIHVQSVEFAVVGLLNAQRGSAGPKGLRWDTLVVMRERASLGRPQREVFDSLILDGWTGTVAELLEASCLLAGEGL